MRAQIAFTAAALALVSGGAAASTTTSAGVAQEPPPTQPPAPPPPQPNPCLGAERAKLRCPDIRMGVPGDMYAQRTPRGRVLVRATNDVKSRGKGPIMFRGRRKWREEMSARQHIYRVDGS